MAKPISYSVFSINRRLLIACLLIFFAFKSEAQETDPCDFDLEERRWHIMDEDAQNSQKVDKLDELLELMKLSGECINEKKGKERKEFYRQWEKLLANTLTAYIELDYTFNDDTALLNLIKRNPILTIGETPDQNCEDWAARYRQNKALMDQGQYINAKNNLVGFIRANVRDIAIDSIQLDGSCEKRWVNLIDLTLKAYIKIYEPNSTKKQSEPCESIDCNFKPILDLQETAYKKGKYYDALEKLTCLYDSRPFCDEAERSRSEKRGYKRQKERLLSLMARSYIGLDMLYEADAIIDEILYTNSLFDPPTPLKFKRMVEAAKKRRLAFSTSSVSKKPENIYQAPATVVLLDQEKIRRRGYIDLDQMFDDLPGFDVSRTVATTYSNIYQRGYRSLATSRTIFMINGIEDNDFWGNLSYWSRQIPISNVERVEIVYGPASTMYGKNAMAGVVNVITKDPVEMVREVSALGAELGISAEIGANNSDILNPNTTKYGDITITGKIPDRNVYASVTGRVYLSNETDFSNFNLSSSLPAGFPNRHEYNFASSDYGSLDYLDILGLGNDPQDTAIAAAARHLDSMFMDTTVVNNGVEDVAPSYSNRLKQYYILAKLKVDNLTLGYQTWYSEQGNMNFGNDNSRLGADFGGLWIPRQSTLFANYETNLGPKVILSNTAQFRISEVSDNSKVVSLKNYSNGGISPDSIIVDGSFVSAKSPFWQTQLFFQRSKQFRNELKVIYSPLPNLDFIAGVEYRFSDNQGDYQTIILDEQLVGGSYLDPENTPSISGTSSLDGLPGGNSIDYQELGIFLQGTYKFRNESTKHDWLGVTLGARYDTSRIGSNAGYGNIINPRAAIVFTPLLNRDICNCEDDYKPSDNHFYMKGIYSSAFLDPSSRDRFSVVNATRKVNNPDLDPETAQNLEAVIGFHRKKTVGIELAYYYSIYQGTVDQVPVDACELSDGTFVLYDSSEPEICGPEPNLVPTNQNQNIGELDVEGVQFSAWAQLPYHIYLYANYTHTNSSVPNPDAENDPIPVGDIAADRINFGGNVSFWEDRVNLNLRGNYVGPRPVGPETTVPANPQPNGQFNSYFLLNGALTISNIPGLPGVRVQGVANNILDKQYFHPGIRGANGNTLAFRTPQPRRNMMVRLIYDF